MNATAFLILEGDDDDDDDDNVFFTTTQCQKRIVAETEQAVYVYGYLRSFFTYDDRCLCNVFLGGYAVLHLVYIFIRTRFIHCHSFPFTACRSV